MRHVWIGLNLVLIGVSVWTGYSEKEPQKLRQANPGAIFCFVVLVTTTVFSLGSVWYSVSSAKQIALRRPSLRRFSIDWWHDPLQCLFLSCCFTAAMAVGAAFRLRETTQTGFWMFIFFVCMFVGLLIGQFIQFTASASLTPNQAMQPTARAYVHYLC